MNKIKGNNYNVRLESSFQIAMTWLLLCSRYSDLCRIRINKHSQYFGLAPSEGNGE